MKKVNIILVEENNNILFKDVEMVSSKDNKVVDYGGTALSVCSIMVCFAFYPALVFAAHCGTWFAKNCFLEYELYYYETLVQAVFFVIGISFISALGALAKEFKICILFLIIIYVVTFMPAWRLLMSCYN
jgi:hypothetical protein